MVGLDAYLEAVNQVEAPLYELYDKLRWRPLYMSGEPGFQTGHWALPVQHWDIQVTSRFRAVRP